MSHREVFVFESIEKFINGSIKRSDVAILVGKSERTISRLARRVEQKGLLGVKHGNALKAPHNRLDKKLALHIEKLIKQTYFDFNMSHIQEVLKNNHGISIAYTTLRRLCHRINIVKKRKRSRSDLSRKKRRRMAHEGFLLQMDGSPHLYNGKDEWSLIAAIDDASNDIPYAEFFLSETTFNCMTVLEQIIKRRGRPWAIYVDRAGWLGGGKRKDFGEFRRACEELQIEVIFANSPQAKGRIERWFQVAQDRLVAEMRLNKITRMQQANEYLQKIFLNEYWNKEHRLEPGSDIVKYRPLPIGVDLNEIFTKRVLRKINYDHTFKWAHKIFQILNPPGNISNQRVELRFYRDNSSKVFFADRQLEVQLWLPTVKQLAS